MNFRILNYFLTVAHEKNITKAAEVLHITQPTLSRQLMQLEEDLGTKLFDRSQHKFALTPSGQFLVQRAQEILDMVEKTTLDIQDQEQNLSGSIAFGAGEYYATQTLAQLIGAFQRQYPAVTFDLFTATADTLLEKMEKGLIDIAILQAPVDTTNYDYIHLQKRKFGVFSCARMLLWQQEKPLKPVSFAACLLFYLYACKYAVKSSIGSAAILPKCTLLATVTCLPIQPYS